MYNWWDQKPVLKAFQSFENSDLQHNSEQIEWD